MKALVLANPLESVYDHQPARSACVCPDVAGAHPLPTGARPEDPQPPLGLIVGT